MEFRWSVKFLTDLFWWRPGHRQHIFSISWVYIPQELSAVPYVLVFRDHVAKENHVINWSGAKILEREGHWKTRQVKESIWIRKRTQAGSAYCNATNSATGASSVQYNNKNANYTNNSLHFYVVVWWCRHNMSTLLYLACRLVVMMLWNRRQRLVLLVRTVRSARHCRLHRCLFIINRHLWLRDFWRLLYRFRRTFFVRNVYIAQCRIFWNCTTPSTTSSVILNTSGFCFAHIIFQNYFMLPKGNIWGLLLMDFLTGWMSFIIIIIIIKNECHSNIIVDRLQGCSHSKKLREIESESRSSKVVWQARYQL